MKRFIDPMAQVIITDPDSGETWHWGDPNYPFLTSVTMIWSSNMTIDSLIVGINMPFDYAISALDSSKTPFRQNNIIKARIGYLTGGWTEWAQGVLASGGKGLTLSPDGLSGSLEINAIPMKPAGYTLTKDLIDFVDHDSKKIVETLIFYLGYEVSITDKAQDNLKAIDDTKISDPSLKEKKDLYPGLIGQTIWGALQHVCRTSDCQLITRDMNGKKTVIIYTEYDITHGNIKISDVINTYSMRGILDTTINQYPCFSFSPSSDEAVWINNVSTAAASGVNARGIDTETGDDVRKDVQAKDQEDARDGNIEHPEPQDIKYPNEIGGDIIADTSLGGSLGTYMSAPILPGGKKMFENQANLFQRQGDLALNMEIETIGVPDEKVGNFCRLFNAGVLYNGTYMIERMTQAWSPGNWTMTIGVYRRGWKAIMGEKRQTAGGQLP